MVRIIGVAELRRRFRSILDQMVEGNTPYVVTRGSRPEAALVSYEEFLRYRALRERDVLDRFDHLGACMAEQNAAFDEEEVTADVAAAMRILIPSCSAG